MNNNRNKNIANLQFVLSLLVMSAHATTNNVNLPGEALQSVHGLNYSSFIQTFFTSGLCRIAVPIYFMLSGYYFYNTFDGSFVVYKNKIRKRVYSLVYPYLFWSGSVFFAFYIAQKIPFLKSYFSTRNVDHISLRVLLQYVLFDSFNSPLWFLKYLIIISALSILLYPIFDKFPLVIVVITFYCWFFNCAGIPLNIPIRMDAVFFYSIGSIFAIKQNDLKYITEYVWDFLANNYVILIFIYIVLLTIRSYKICDLPVTNILMGQYGIFLHLLGKIGILLGCTVFIFVFLYIDYNNELWINDYTFLIFVMHHPIVNTFKKLLLKILGVNHASTLIAFFLSICFTLMIIVLFGTFFKSKFPKAFYFMTGNR